MADIRPYSMKELMNKIKTKDYFRFPKLLHGFWDRLDFFSEGTDDINRVISNIQNFGENFGDKVYSEQLIGSQFFEGRGTLGVGPHYIEIIKLLIKDSPNILWGISDTNFHGDNPKTRSNEGRAISKKWIDLVVQAKMVDGCFWKDIISSGRFPKFLNDIEDFAVVVIGMKHLSSLRETFGFKDFHFVEVQMPLAPRLSQFQNELEEFQSKLGRPAVYMSQMSIDGVPLICNASLPEVFFFDIGRGLDAFSKTAVERGWEETIPTNLKALYKNESFRKQFQSKIFL